MIIRPFSINDYPAVAAVHNAALPESPVGEAEMRHEDALRDPKHRAARFIAQSEGDGRVIGVGEYGQSLFNFHPQTFFVQIFVALEHQRQGVGSALYDVLEGEIAAFDPLSLRANARENRTASVTFLQKRGYKEEMRHGKSHLNVTAFDPARFTAEAEKTQAAGIVIKTYAELHDEPKILSRMYELTNTVGSDVPSLDAPEPIPYEQWLYFVQGPTFLPDAVFVAIESQSGQFVGFSNLFASEAGDYLNTGLTGVRREHRGKGIATALKLCAIAYAQSIGSPQIRTSNESNNRAMLGINERLGFVQQPAEINFVKRFGDA